MKTIAHIALLITAFALAGCAAPHQPTARADHDGRLNPYPSYHDLDFEERRQADVDQLYSASARSENKRQAEKNNR